MKKLYFLLVAILVTTFSFAQTTDLLISKYGEGSGDNKFLEIYNGTGADVDLGNYSISSCSNGCNTNGEFDFPDNITFAPGTILADGDVYVISDPDAAMDIADETDQTFPFLSNGDDAYALTVAGATADTYTIIDILGDLGDDPGAGWPVAGVNNGTQNSTLTRKASVCSPNPIPLSSFGTDAADSEWIVGPSNSGWDTLGSFMGCDTSPTVSILSPSDFEELPSGTTSVDVVFTVSNAPGATVNITYSINSGAPVNSTDVMSPFPVGPLVDGDSVTLTAELIDGGVIDFETIDFNIAFPCDIQVGTITATCDQITPATDDTYSVTIDYTGGGTTQYSIDTGGVGSVGGDDPSSVADGTITITGIQEGTDFTVNFLGDASNSSCDFTRNIDSPDCDPQLTLPLYEPFDYSVGTNLIDANNWENVSDSFDEVVIGGPGGLTYPNLAEGAQNGNHISFDGGGSDPGIEFEGVSAGTVYASFLFNITDNSLVTTPGYFAVLSSGSFNFDARLWTVPVPPPSGQGTADQFQIGISNANSVPSGAELDPTLFSIGSTVFVVMSYSLDDGTINAWVNPSDATFGAMTAPASTATTSEAGDIVSGITQFVVRQDSDTETPFFLFDELRIGATWADVTPTALSTEEFNANSFKVYPNPSNLGYVTIDSSNNASVGVEVFDILGKQILNTTTENNRLDVSQLNPGMYLMKITQNNASVTKKLIIK